MVATPSPVEPTNVKGRAMKPVCHLLAMILLVVVGAHSATSAENIRVYADIGTVDGPVRFAVGDVITALQAKGFVVEVRALSALSAANTEKKVVIALASDTAVTAVLAAQGGQVPTGLGEQAYELSTTATSGNSFWVIAGDPPGAMYGGLQLAEELAISGFSTAQAKRVSPNILRRGTKLNMSLDRRLPTYAGGSANETTSIGRSIKQAWDMGFWTEWIDQQARNRYNVLTVWNHNPFPALVTVPGWEKATIPYVEGVDDDFKEDRTLTIEKRQQFWKDVMRYAKSRGFDFYFFNWNVTPEFAKDVYPQLKHEDIEAQANKDYYNAAIKELLKTYPDLAGFGVSPGDAMPSSASKKDIADWVFAAYSKGLAEFASANRSRKFTFIHRLLKVEYTDVHENWKTLLANNPNLTFDCSMKYCVAYTYSTTTPQWAKFDLSDLQEQGASTWLTLRNDGFFYSDFGDSRFVREFIGNLPDTKYSGGAHDGKVRIRGFYLGHDAYTPTRSYLYKNQALNQDPVTGKAMLEIQRKWYMEMLWGRIGYDKNVSDEVFVRNLAKQFPSLPSALLFEAWAKASRSQAKIVELVQGEWKLDSHFYTEFCMRRNDGENLFRTIGEFLNGNPEDGGSKPTFPARGSETWLASIKETAEGRAGGKTTSYELADEIEANGMTALTIIAQMSSGGDQRTEAMLSGLKTQAFMSIYYAHKIRGATLLGAGKRDEARDAMYQAYGWWIHYVTAMDALYLPDNFRTYELKDIGWNHWNTAVLKEYRDLGGSGTPNLPTLPGNSTAPVIISPATAIATAGASFTYQIAATGSPTTFAATGLPTGLSINASNGLITGAIAAAGQASFTVTATNSKGTGSLVVKVTVNPASLNTKPTISNLADATVDEDKSLGPVSFVIGDKETPAAALTLSVTSSNSTLLPLTGIVFGGTGVNRTVVLNPASNQNGKSTVTVTVSDGSLSASTYLSFTVRAVNDAPILDHPLPDQRATVNQAFSFVVPANTMSDPEATALTWSAKGLPDGITFAPATRTLSGTPMAAGEWTVTITASDGTLNTSDEFIFVVEPVGGNGIKINFQPESAPKVSGYLVDGGRAFGPRSGTGYSYGWNFDMPEHTRDRNSSQSPDQTRDTVILTQRIPSCAWEIAIPNGRYLVRVVAGDPDYFADDIRYSYAVEGAVVVQGTPTSANRWFDDTDPVEVKDGRLTLENGANANRNRLCLIEIVPMTPSSN
jgi:Putative Ig domain